LDQLGISNIENYNSSAWEPTPIETFVGCTWEGEALCATMIPNLGGVELLMCLTLLAIGLMAAKLWRTEFAGASFRA